MRRAVAPLLLALAIVSLLGVRHRQHDERVAGRAIFDQDSTPVGDPATYFFAPNGFSTMTRALLAQPASTRSPADDLC